jgi:hypothetical protein
LNNESQISAHPKSFSFFVNNNIRKLFSKDMICCHLMMYRRILKYPFAQETRD